MLFLHLIKQILSFTFSFYKNFLIFKHFKQEVTMQDNNDIFSEILNELMNQFKNAKTIKIFIQIQLFLG